MTADTRARTAAILTVSDRGSRGETVDTAGPAVARLLSGAGFEVVAQVVLPDEPERISSQLRAWADDDHVDLVLTAGGTGLAPRDRTPEATARVLDYPVPGLAEAMRSAGLASTPMAMLSRAVAGVRGRTLIINLPGSERGATESLAVVLPVLAHAVDQLGGGDHLRAGS
ncbi:MAG: MogA/MoaB family molybdenum cofactor biosynthesis protein [Dehalococcoidia bacterium]